METNEMDTETRMWVSLWAKEIDTLLPQRKTMADQLFTATCSFLAWTRDFSHVPRINEGRECVWGIIRTLVKEGSLDANTREVAMLMLHPKGTPTPKESAVP